MQITSSNFQHQETIPLKFTQYDENVNPALTFSEIPENTQSLALIVEDPDTPQGTLIHWALYNMSPGTLQIIEGSLPVSGAQATNYAGNRSYTGPKPPEGTGTHRYFFKLYALDEQLDVAESISGNDLRDVLSDHIIERAEIIGTFSAEDNK